MGVVPSPQYPHRSSTFTRGTKHQSRPRSRVFLDHDDWKLDPLLFTELNQVWSPLEVDPVCLSASNSTSTVLQLDTRPSFGGIGCVFPGLEQSEGICPPSLCSSRPVPQIVTIGQNVSHLVLVAPVWQSQPWYSLLLGLRVAPPIMFSLYPGPLTRQREVHSLLNLQLADWLLSANHIQKQAFHNQFKLHLLPPDEMEHPKPIDQRGVGILWT